MELNEVINFLDPKYETKVKCSCIEDDFHVAENLVSSEKQKLSRGFMAYNVVKPPIDLEFKLCCCIELMLINIWPQIDSLKSTGFEIHVNGDDNQTEYRKIGSHFNLKENRIRFVNNLMTESDNCCDSNSAVIHFYPSVKNQLRKVKNIKVTIKQTTRCTPVIKKIEVWGKISKFASNEQKQSVQQAILKTASQANCDSAEQREVKNTQTNDDHSESSKLIPEDFLDAITYEIMALPMVLPSGKTIDNSTLLKHTEHEEKWGRVPSDPFTGQSYTDIRKPVLNVHLKSQIDAFLLKNCAVPEVSMLPRTVGSISKRRTDNNQSDFRHHKVAKIETHSTNGSTQNSSSSSSSTPPLSSTSLPATRANIHSTLDEAVRAVLNIGKYTKSSAAIQNDSNTNKCFQCCQVAHTVLYTIATCSHLICRNCLVNRNLMVCKCGLAFSNIDVNKYHSKNILSSK